MGKEIFSLISLRAQGDSKLMHRLGSDVNERKKKDLGDGVT